MKFRLLFSALVLSISVSSICAAKNYNNNHQQGATTERIKANQLQQDGPIIAWVIVLNNNEINAAKEASNRKLDTPVARFAKLMTKEHKQNLRETLQVSKKIKEKPIKTDAAVSLAQAGKQQLAELKSLDDNAFQKAYMDAMVKDHNEALDKLDNDYLKTVSNPTLKRHLEKTRQHVALHLEKAKSIQAELNNTANA